MMEFLRAAVQLRFFFQAGRSSAWPNNGFSFFNDHGGWFNWVITCTNKPAVDPGRGLAEQGPVKHSGSMV